MARINLDIPDELLQQLADEGKSFTDFFQEQLLNVSENSAPSLRIEPLLTQRFQALSEQWRKETRHFSLVSDIVLNTAYQQIIG